MKNKSLRIGFIHPDLGIGGAESLIINLALALQNKKHRVKIYTPYHNPDHCYKETKDGTLDVEVRGNMIPRQIFGKFTALCAYIRMIFATLYVVFYGGHFDVIIVDQVSACIPILKVFGRRSIFYCHFPDKLLCVERSSIIKKVYRLFMDSIEEICLLFSDLILVNSDFTRQIYYESFRLLTKIKKQKPEILYPSIDLKKFDSDQQSNKTVSHERFFISLNRFERKKNIGLAIQSFAKFYNNSKSSQNCKLVVAGGYDSRITENVQHYQELVALAKELKVENQIEFKQNITEQERIFYLQNAEAILYTPDREHFGIVPVEAMYMQRPVIAINSGGPKESVKNEETGYLLDQECSQWANKMQFIYENKEKAKVMGQNGKKRVLNMFSFEAFSNQIEEYVYKLVPLQKQKKLQ